MEISYFALYLFHRLQEMAERNFLPQFMVRGKTYSPTARKPPGGDTNDIFGLEARQRKSNVAIYNDRKMKNTASPGKPFVFSNKCP